MRAELEEIQRETLLFEFRVVAQKHFFEFRGVAQKHFFEFRALFQRQQILNLYIHEKLLPCLEALPPDGSGVLHLS
mgnify:CR=1 FL=1